jgi:hypothetical protein
MLDTFGGTLILDEADLRYSDKTADLVKILNNGTVKGLPVLRSVQTRNKEFNPAAFDVFGPKIVAMRGGFRDQALESRFLTEAMGARPLRSNISIQLPTDLRRHALELRNKLLDFRLKTYFSLRNHSEQRIEGIGPRLNQTAASLLALIDDADVRTDFAAMLRRQDQELAAARHQDLDGRARTVVQAAFEESSRSFLPVREIAERINAGSGSAETAVSARQVGQVLRELSVPLYKSHGTIGVLRSGAEKHKAIHSNESP